MEIRPYRPADCRQIARLFYSTVHTVCAKDYAPRQLNAWADGKTDLQEWNRSYLRHRTLVAEENGRIIGFGDITREGYLDRLYVHRSFQGRGVGTALCSRLEQFAAQAHRITTHASITARPFFLQRGYHTVRMQWVVRKGVVLNNYLMEKSTGFSKKPKV